MVKKQGVPMKKIFFLVLPLIIMVSCNKKDVSSGSVRSMQEVSDEIGDYPDREQEPVHQEIVETPIVEEVPVTETVINTLPEQGNYTAQLISLKIHFRAMELFNKLRAAGYEVEMNEVYINGETMFRIRLAGSYSRNYAEEIAKKIQSEFTEVEDFWIIRR